MEEKAALKLIDETSNDDASSIPQTSKLMEFEPQAELESATLDVSSLFTKIALKEWEMVVVTLTHNTSSNLSLVVKALSVVVVVTGVEGKSEKRMMSLEDLYSGTTKKLTLSRNNPIIDPEINGLGDIISAVDEADVEFDDTKKRIKLQPDSVHHVLGEICSADSSSRSHNYEDTVDADVHISSDDQINMEKSSRISKPEDGDEVMETSSMSDDKLLDNLKKDQNALPYMNHSYSDRN
ncbi:hypothetical protein AgCh_034298 [Apium graveolens]